jgi:hypothetical protein
VNDERRRQLDTHLRGLGVEVELARIRFVTLERAYEQLEEELQGDPDRCDQFHDKSRCAGTPHVVWCRACGHVVKRCDAHGSRRAASVALRYHEANEHGDGYARAAPADDTRAVS